MIGKDLGRVEWLVEKGKDKRSGGGRDVVSDIYTRALAEL